MPEAITIGAQPLSIEHLIQVSRYGAQVTLAHAALDRVVKGRVALERRIAQGDRIYGVNTGVGSNQKFDLTPEDAARLQANLMRHLSCATGQPLPAEVVRGAILLRIATFATGTSAVRPELVQGLADLLNLGITPIVPRYGSVGASGDLMPSAYIARVLMGMGEVEYAGARMTAEAALHKAGLAPLVFAPKEGLALINGTTVMTSVAALLFDRLTQLLHSLLGAITLSVEALEVPQEPYQTWVHEQKGHPGQIAVAEFCRAQFADSENHVGSAVQSCYSLRCAPQGLGPAWEALYQGRAVIEREMNSANDNPLIDPETGTLYRAGNFYGGHISRLLDTWKLDIAAMGNWANALVAVLVDDRFNNGLPANLVRDPGVNSGLKGLQLSVTSLACAIRQMAGSSLIHSLPTEQYNQDVVSLGMHSAVTAMDAAQCLRDEIAMAMIAAAQAAELRGNLEALGTGNERTFDLVRRFVPFLDADRPLEHEIAALATHIGMHG